METTKIRVYPEEGMQGMCAMAGHIGDLLAKQPDFFNKLNFTTPELKFDDWNRPYFSLEGPANSKITQIARTFLMSLGGKAVYARVNNSLVRYVTTTTMKEIKAANLRIPEPNLMEDQHDLKNNIVTSGWLISSSSISAGKKLIEKDVSAFSGPGVNLFNLQYPSMYSPARVLDPALWQKLCPGFRDIGFDAIEVVQIPRTHLKKLALHAHKAIDAALNHNINYLVISVPSSATTEFLEKNLDYSVEDFVEMQAEVVPAPVESQNHLVYLAGLDDNGNKLFTTDGFGTWQTLMQFFDINVDTIDPETTKSTGLAISPGM